MDPRRARILGGSAILAGLLAATWAGPVGAADCTLTAPPYVNVGTPLTIDGAGFPASSAVAIAITLDGAESDAFSVQSDAAGALEIALTPEAIDIGATVVTATAGSTCSAQVAYTVLGAGATPPPAPTEEPGTTAGGATAPRTDAASVGGSGAGSPGGGPWVLAVLLVVLGAAGRFVTGPGRQR
jgi:hypothetical protein